MLVEKRNNLIRLTSFVLILALIFSIPMFGQSGDVYAEDESATSPGVEEPAQSESVGSPAGVDVERDESDITKTKDKKEAEKQAKASDPAALIFDVSEGDITINEGTSPGMLKVTYGGGAVVEYTDSERITIIGSTIVYNVTIFTSKEVNLNIRDLNILMSLGAGRPAMDLKVGSNVNLVLLEKNTLSGGGGYAGLSVPSGASVVIDAPSTEHTLGVQGAGGGAGIGGSSMGGGLDAGNIKIINGSINVTSDSRDAGIGGAWDGTNGGNGGNVEIWGGKVSIQATDSAGIGGSYGGNGGSTKIYGGLVVIDMLAGGAGIGGGGWNDVLQEPAGHGGNIEISGGDVKITAAGGAGIGGGSGSSLLNNNASSGSIKITGGRIIAKSYSGADIGIGNYGNAEEGSVVIAGGSVKATKVSPEAVNGDNENVYLNTLTVGSPNIGNDKEITGLKVNEATPNYGLTHVKTMDNGKVYFWLPKSGSDGKKEEIVEAQSDNSSYYYRYRRDTNPQVRTLKQRFDVSGAISGVSNVSGVAVKYTVNGAEDFVKTDSSGKYIISVAAGADLMTYAPEIEGYKSYLIDAGINAVYSDSVFATYIYNANKYKVTFNAIDATLGQDNKTVTYDAIYGDLPIATKSGYTFRGWYNSDTDGNEITSGSIVKTAENHNLYARFEGNKYEVSFDANGGGTPSKANMVTTYNDPYGELATVSRTGYTFDGWYTTTSYAVEITSGSIMETMKDHTLYAKWEVNDYKVLFDSNGGDTPSKTTMGATYDNPYGELATVSRTGYTFDGWYTTTAYAVEITSGSIVNIPDDHTLYAKWTANDYEVSFNSNGGNTPSKTTMGATYDDPYGELATVSRTGYTFDGWYTTTAYTDEITSGSIVNITDDQILYAKWIPNKYTITFNKNGGNSVSPSTKVVTYDSEYGTLATAVKSGYTFEGWFTSQTGGTEIKATDIVDITADTTLYARWSANSYSISFDSSGGTAPTPSTKDVTRDKAYGELPSVSREGYTFLGWYKAPSGRTEITADSIVKLTDDASFYARWIANDYTVTFDLNGGDEASHATKKVTYDYKHGQLPTATKAGYTFAGWHTATTGGVEVTSADYVKKADDVTLYAKWTANDYKVTLDVNGGNKLTDNSKTVTKDSTYGNLPTPTKKGHAFQGWFTAKTGGIKITADTKVETTSDQILYAQWKAKTYKITFKKNAKKVKKLKPKSKKVVYGTKLGKLPKPKKAGFKFKGWYTKKKGGTKVTKKSIMKYDKNIKLYAKWAKKKGKN